MFSMDSSISRFFSNESATSTFGGPVIAVHPQGRFSYTVSANNDSTIVQFRERCSPLPITAVADSLLMTHGRLVAPFDRLSFMGVDDLKVYKVDKLPGVNYSEVTELVADDMKKSMTFVEGLANFFAQAWMRGREDLTSQQHGELAASCRTRFHAVSKLLPDRLLPMAAHVRENMDQLFTGSYPIVLTHGDLSEMNMLVDEASGALTAVVDWAEASCLPFGFSLYTLESILGDMCLTGWTYRDDAEEPRKRFWDVFDAMAQPLATGRELMKVARLVGILFRYGTPVDGGFPGMLGVRGKDDGSLAFLEAFVSVDMK